MRFKELDKTQQKILTEDMIELFISEYPHRIGNPFFIIGDIVIVNNEDFGRIINIEKRCDCAYYEVESIECMETTKWFPKENLKKII